MPELSEQQILTKIDCGDLSLLSIDTSVLRRYNYAFEKGILKHLSQFSSSKIDIVFSDIVIREMTSHMMTAANKANKDIDKALENIANVRGVSKDKIKSDIEKFAKIEDPYNTIENRIKNFITSTNATYVKTSEYLSTEKLIHSYFNEMPPFEKKDSKKNEFPDAMALQSLEKYALGKNTLMLVISLDKGWKNFCESSTRLVCIEDLGLAMGYFHRVPSVAGIALADQIHQINPYIESTISEHYEIMGVDFWAHSNYIVDYEVTEVRYMGLRYSGKNPFNLINYYEKYDSYVFELTIDADVYVEADFTFYAGSDEKSKKIGETTKGEVFSHDVSVLITVKGDLNDDFQVDKVEITRIDDECNFGEVDPE